MSPAMQALEEIEFAILAWQANGEGSAEEELDWILARCREVPDEEPGSQDLAALAELFAGAWTLPELDAALGLPASEAARFHPGRGSQRILAIGKLIVAAHEAAEAKRWVLRP